MTGGQNGVNQYYFNLKIHDTTARDLRGRLQALSVKPRNITFDLYQTFTRKQGKTESLEHCGLTEHVVKGNFKCTAFNDGGLKLETIRDLFTANMSNDEVQKDQLAESESPEHAPLDYAVRRENGLENQIQIKKQGTSCNHGKFTNTKTEQVNFVQKRGSYKSQPRGVRKRGGTTSRNSNDRPSQKKIAKNTATHS